MRFINKCALGHTLASTETYDALFALIYTARRKSLWYVGKLVLSDFYSFTFYSNLTDSDMQFQILLWFSSIFLTSRKYYFRFVNWRCFKVSTPSLPKLQPFCGRDFQNAFHVWKLECFNSRFAEIRVQGSVNNNPELVKIMRIHICAAQGSNSTENHMFNLKLVQ